MQLRTSFYHVAASLLLAAVLSACSPLPPQTGPAQDPDLARAADLLADGQFLQASALYQALAGRVGGARGADFLLDAADSARQGDDLDRASALARQARELPLNAPQSLRLDLLQAEIQLARHQGDLALSGLLALENAGLPAELYPRYLRNLANAYRQMGNLLETARTLQRLDRVLGADVDARLAVQEDILRALTALNERTLRELQPSPPGESGGWMQLALLIKAHGSDPDVLAPHLQAWRARFPAHPMLPQLLQRSIERLQQQVLQLDHIAVLLPQQGRYAGAALAIQEGILASFYEIPEAKRPRLRFYDSSDPASAWPLYIEAVNNGAQAVIGPLQKPAVSQLLRAGQLEVPVLALNQVSEANAPPLNLFMFSLDPEQEAVLAAERIWQTGQRQPVTLVPDNEWGARLQKAFSNRWQTLTGELVDGRAYPAESSDYSEAISALLHLDRSQARHARMQRWLGQRVEFEPRRRQDVDAVFVAAYPQQAQSMHPQLAFFRAGDLPMYTTSHAWTGTLNRQQLADMRGILLPDLPLLAVPADRERLGQTLPGILGPGVRLYAMGIDALRLLPHLQRMRASLYETLDGQTGNLYMDSAQRVQRQLVWLRLDEPAHILGYSDRMDLDGSSELNVAPLEEAPLDPGAAEPAPGAGAK